MNDDEKAHARRQVEMFLDHLKDRYDLSLDDLVQMKKHLTKVTGWQNWVWNLIKMLLVVILWEGLKQITVIVNG